VLCGFAAYFIKEYPAPRWRRRKGLCCDRKSI
jgi:hypothetical protein